MKEFWTPPLIAASLQGKPRIYLVFGAWNCGRRGDFQLNYLRQGPTPAQAYARWSAQFKQAEVAA